MSNKIKPCKVCGKEMAKTAKVCPGCGAKNKKPFYKSSWFIILVIIIIISAIAGNKNDVNDVPANNAEQSQTANEKKEPEQKEYVVCEVSTLMDLLEDNALKAKNEYENKYVEITGRLSVIDSGGKYISVTPSNDEFAIMGVQCNIKNDEQKNKVLELSTNSTITVKGKITSVGEVLGYSLDIEEIK